MGLFRKILIFTVLTAGIILLGRLAGRFLPRASAPKPAAAPESEVLRDSTNALPAVEADTTGGRWHERLFDPLERAHALSPKSLRHKTGYYEIAFPKGRPIHEYALDIERICRARGITVVQGAELRPPNRSVEYLLESNGHRIKLRATLGASVMAGAAKLAIVFTGLDSLRLSQAEALLEASWGKTLVIDPYNPNPALKALRRGGKRVEILAELPMEPSSYPYVNPGKNALFIHHGKEDVERILGGALDSLPAAAGFASRYGDRAIENLPLLEKLFRFTAGRKLVFLDLTGSQRSLARQAAAAQGARSRTLALFRDSLALEEELSRKAAAAQKTGEAVLALPYSGTAFRLVSRTLEANAQRFAEIGLELSALSALGERDTVGGVESAASRPENRKAPSAARPAARNPQDGKAEAQRSKAAASAAPKSKPAATRPAKQEAPAGAGSDPVQRAGKPGAPRAAPAPARPKAKPVPARKPASAAQ